MKEMKRCDNAVQESRFDYKGFPCVVLFMDMGHRCGYVGIPEASGIDVDDISCHGGITYGPSSYLTLQEDDNIEWIGFDTAHYMDGRDTEKIREYFPNKPIYEWESVYKDNFRTLEYCEEECKQIVEQVIDMLGEEEEEDMNMNNNILKAIEEKQKEIDDLHKELARLEKYKQYDETADEFKAIHTSFMNAGFSDEQAFALIQSIIGNICKNPNFVKVI